MNIQPFNAVYYVESSDKEKAYNPLAIKPRFFSYDNGQIVEQRCEWQDTDRGTYFFYNKLEIIDPKKQKENVPPRQFKLIGNNSEEITFTYLTARLFEEKVADKTWKKPQLSQDEELQAYYLRTFSSSSFDESL